MHQPNDRRSAVRRLAAGMAAVRDANPDLRPTAGPSEHRGIAGVEGCDCGRDNRCGVCLAGRHRRGHTSQPACLA